jgi:hypothetical protein
MIEAVVAGPRSMIRRARARDRSCSRKPALSAARLEPRLTAPSDDDQQPSRGARRDRDARLR